MSGLLPTTVDENSNALDSPPGLDFVSQLLDEQQALTAVERFSTWHDIEEPAQAKYYRSLLPASAPAPGQQFAFRVDLDACSGCKACVVACHTLNGLEERESWRRVGAVGCATVGEPVAVSIANSERSLLPAPDATADPFALSILQHVTTACHHCEDPGCLNGCPVKAYAKDPVTGIVRHLDDQCIGCKYCTMMCPYEVPQYNERLGIVRKCDMCHQRLGAGEAPACVQACPNGAIAIDIVEVGGGSKESTARLAPGAPLSSITRPTTRYVSRRWSADDSAIAVQVDPFAGTVPQDLNVDEVAESHWPLALMLVATQVSVGMLIAERIAAAALWISGETMPVLATGCNALVALLIAAIGMGIAPLHLGQPLRAWRVFLGLRTSWLSREAVVLGKYMGGLVVATALLWQSLWGDWLLPEMTSWIPAWAAKTALGVTTLIGVAGLYCSAMIYIATRRRLWRTSRTLSRFFGTAGAAGAVVTTAALLCGGAPSTAAAFTLLGSITILVWKLQWEWTTLLDRRLGSSENEDFRSKLLVHNHLAPLRQIRLVCGRAGLAATLLAFPLLLADVQVVPLILMVFASLSLIGGEFAERLLYFQSVVYDRMPGTLR